MMQSNTITPPAYLGQWGAAEGSETAAEEEEEQEQLSTQLNIESDLNVTQISMNDRKQIAKIVALVLRDDPDKWSEHYIQGLAVFLELDPKEINNTSLLSFIGATEKECNKAVSILGWSTLPQRTKFLLLILHYSIAGNKEGLYDARARALLRQLCAYLNVPWNWFESQELRYANAIKRAVMESKNDLEESANKSRRSRYLKIAGAGLVGGVLLAVTGGLAAPAVAAGLGVITAGTAGAIFAGSTGLIMITSLFGVAGAGLLSRKMKRRVQGLREFEFDLVRGSTEANALTVTLGVDGWLTAEEIKQHQLAEPAGRGSASGMSVPGKAQSPPRENTSSTWQFLAQRTTEAYTLRWETEALGQFGNGLQTFTSTQVKGALKSAAFTQVVKETVLSAVAAALTWPAMLLSLADVVDNPWSIVMSQSAKAAISLADVLEERMAGNRPVNIIAYSMGARVVFLALEELARRSTLSPAAAAALAACKTVSVPPPSPAAVAVVAAVSPPVLDIKASKEGEDESPTPTTSISQFLANPNTLSGNSSDSKDSGSVPLYSYEDGICWSCGGKGCHEAHKHSSVQNPSSSPSSPASDSTLVVTTDLPPETLTTAANMTTTSSAATSVKAAAAITSTSAITTASTSTATTATTATANTQLNPVPYKGLILDVLLLGTPVEADLERWAKVRSIVAGRLIHCYSPSDLVLRFLYRASQATLAVAALQKIDVSGVESYDLDLSGHSDYKANVEKAALSVNFFNFCCERSIGDVSVKTGKSDLHAH